MTPASASLHPLLLDTPWWRDRLRAMERVPRHLLVFPLNRGAPPGADGAELWLRAHDGIRLRGMLGWSLLSLPRPNLRIQLLRTAADAPGPVAPRIDWDAVSEGEAHLLFEPPPSRRLEDRVLDILRIAHATRALTRVGDCPLELTWDRAGPAPDELHICANLLLAWDKLHGS